MSDFKPDLKKASKKKLSTDAEGELRKRISAPPETDAARSTALEIARAALNKKAENLKILDVSKTSGFTDYFVICSAMSDRQIEAIGEEVRVHLRSLDRNPLSTEGLEEARWVLIDYGEVVVHIFLDAVRDYYDLEELWKSAPRVSVPREFYESSSGGNLH